MIRHYLTTPLIMLLTAMLIAGCNKSSDASPRGTHTSAADYNPADSARALMDKVDHYYKNVLHDSLYQLAPVAMDFNKRHGQWREYYTTWCLLVNDLVWNGQMDKGLNEAQRMHRDAIERNNSFGISEAYTAMGIAYHFQNNNSEAVRCYQQALNHYPSDGDQSVRQNIYSYYSQVLVEMRDYATLETVLKQWSEFLETQTKGDTNSTKHALWYFRYHRENYKYRFARGQYQQAADELTAMQHYLNLESDRELYEAQVAGFKTQLAMARKDYALAMYYNDQEVELCKQQDFNTFLNALKHRSELLQVIGRYEEALRTFQSYAQQKDSLAKADTRQQLNELNKRFEVDELKAEQERSELEHDRTQLQLVLAIAAILLAALIFFVIWRHQANQRLRVAHAQLEESNHELAVSYEQLKLANARAEESSKMKSNFIRQISHEIRTPLNVLSGFTQVLTNPEMEIDEEEYMDISARVTENTDRITSLVNKMLELSEASSLAEIKRADAVSAEQIAAMAVIQSDIQSASHLHFSTQIDAQAGSAILQTNQRQAARALALLLDNASKFTRQPKGAAPNPAIPENPEAVLRVSQAEGAIAFAVEDTGIGVPTEEAEHIFEEFVQLNEYYSGTGIGLSVARSIARRLGGDITLDTTYTNGARFVMTLPLMEAAEQSEQ